MLKLCSTCENCAEDHSRSWCARTTDFSTSSNFSTTCKAPTCSSTRRLERRCSPLPACRLRNGVLSMSRRSLLSATPPAGWKRKMGASNRRLDGVSARGFSVREIPAFLNFCHSGVLSGSPTAGIFGPSGLSMRCVDTQITARRFSCNGNQCGSAHISSIMAISLVARME